MIVPRHWSEARLRARVDGRQVTLRRFGWSNASAADAEAMANQRVEQAMERVRRGERVRAREPRVPYNGADGVPIREEIVSEHGATVVTRNSYGALCLNTPDVLFADIDYRTGTSGFASCLGTIGLAGLLALGLGLTLGADVGLVAGCAGLVLGWPLVGALDRFLQRLRGGVEAIALRRVRAVVAARRDALVDVYGTPAGLRLLVRDRTFDPAGPEALQFLRAVGSDPLFVRMCVAQRCFRARVSPKPWRIGMDRHMGPRPGVWPIAPRHMATRASWIAEYERMGAERASARFRESVGDGVEHASVRPVRELHDTLGRTRTDLRLA